MGVFPGKAANPNPANLTLRPDDTKPSFEVAALRRLLKLSEHVSSVLGMDCLLIRGGFLNQGLTGAAGDRFVGGIDIGSCPRLGVDHPEDFLNVVGHLMKLLLPVFEDGSYLAFPPAHLADHVGRHPRE